ncbi:hypothetical protein GALMADRAFT_147997 [Galerina marginata CBS 339.88]|uniref:Uncharacterized protein n=1 Tax=Galerina marginata (strain CBS 339.88) TaxID=685588 RepID=A0A067SHI1_GALM3|nr:hypothetical protein GALMADRAFT_147997 [Galerina marginata CBS 339.88]
MRLQTTFIAFPLLVAATTASTVDLVADFNSIKAQTVALNNSVNVFPATGGTLSQAFDINAMAGNLIATTIITWGDIQDAPKPFTDSDANKLLTITEGLQPIIGDALEGVLAKKGAFDALNVTYLVKVDINNLDTWTANLLIALGGFISADELPRVDLLKNESVAAFAAARAVYGL